MDNTDDVADDVRTGWMMPTVAVTGDGNVLVAGHFQSQLKIPVNGGEFAYELFLSKDDGVTWETDKALVIHDPGRRISGRGWPRTVQIDADTLGTLFYDLSPELPDGPGLFFLPTALGDFA